jgi:MFS family permease
VRGRTFRSLRNRNYRLYFLGQVVSLTGTWMQSVAQAWLVLKLTGSGLALGLTVALQFLPMLVAGPWGGLIADRADKRRVLIATQAAAGVLALLLGVLTITGAVRLWMVYALASGLGLVNLFDMPTRQAFVTEMVGPGEVTNAVSLNSVVVNGARVVGPALAGLLIGAVGIGPCFLVNAVSYVAVIVALAAMRVSELHPPAPAERARGQIREGFRYVRSTPDLLGPLLVMAVVGTLAYNFSVVLPLMARFVFHSGAQGYGVLFSAMGAGAMLGGLVVATISRSTRRLLGLAGVTFGLVIVGAALAPTLAVELAVMVPLGAASTWFIATANSLLQLGSDVRMRGRVMALFSVVFVGSTPIGGPLMGYLAQHAGARVALAVGGVSAALAGAASLVALREARRRASLERPRRAPAAVTVPSAP